MNEYQISSTDSMCDALKRCPEDFTSAPDDWPLFRGKRIPVKVIRELPDDLMARAYPEYFTD